MASSDSTSRSAPLRAIIWCAVSGEEQAKDDKTSLETQERDARKFAAEQDFEVVDLLIVGGFSRRFYNYPDFVQAAATDGFFDPERMLEHWKRRDFDVLIARSGDRCGREQGIFGEFVARTIHTGARLFMLTEGWIDEANYRMYIAMGGFSASTQVDRLRQGQKATKLKSASRGLTTNPSRPYSHKWVRNDAGKLLRLELDESKRRLWDDLATVFLEGVGYHNLEQALHERYGHVDERTGKPFTHGFFYQLLYNPYFWGNSGRGYRNSSSKNGHKVGFWVFDSSCPAPEGVHIFYNVNDPVYTGELAARVMAELRRRSSTIHGRTLPHRTQKFARLLLCYDCGSYMVFDGWNAYRCQSYRSGGSDPNRCDRFRKIRDTDVQAWLHARLTEMVLHDAPDLLARGDDRPSLAGRIKALREEISDLEAQARALVVKQGQAHAAIMPFYDDQLQALGERLVIIRKALAETENDERVHETSSAKAAFHELPEDIAELWKWDGTTINQLLHRLMGQRRLVARNGEIVETRDAPLLFSAQGAEADLFRQGTAFTDRMTYVAYRLAGVA